MFDVSPPVDAVSKSCSPRLDVILLGNEQLPSSIPFSYNPLFVLVNLITNINFISGPPRKQPLGEANASPSKSSIVRKRTKNIAKTNDFGFGRTVVSLVENFLINNCRVISCYCFCRL